MAGSTGLAGCSDDGDSDDSGAGRAENPLTEARDNPEEHSEVVEPLDDDTIVIADLAFEVKGPVKQNKAVGITNEDRVAHTVTMDEQPGFDVAVPAEQGEVFLAVHPPGRYGFHCKIHPSMKGTLVIEA